MNGESPSKLFESLSLPNGERKHLVAVDAIAHLGSWGAKECANFNRYSRHVWKRLPSDADVSASSLISIRQFDGIVTN